MHSAFQGKPQTGRPSLLHWAPAVSVDPYKRAPRIEIRPIRLRLSLSNWSCAAIYLLLTDQSEHSILTDQDSAIWTDIDVESLLAYKWTHQGLGADTLLYISQLHLCLNGGHVQFPS